MGELQKNTRFEHLLRLADTNLILGHRMSEWIGKSPILEEELALTNIGLDLIGQARALYEHAVAVSGEEDNRDADDLVFLRDAPEYKNLLLVERENGDFAHTMVRQMFYSAFAVPVWEALTRSVDSEVAGIAGRAEKDRSTICGTPVNGFYAWEMAPKKATSGCRMPSTPFGCIPARCSTWTRSKPPRSRPGMVST